MVLGFEKLNVPRAVVVQVVFVRRMIDVCQMISMGQFKRAQCNSGHDLFICSPLHPEGLQIKRSCLSKNPMMVPLPPVTKSTLSKEVDAHCP